MVYLVPVGAALAIVGVITLRQGRTQSAESKLGGLFLLARVSPATGFGGLGVLQIDAAPVKDKGECLFKAVSLGQAGPCLDWQLPELCGRVGQRRCAACAWEGGVGKYVGAGCGEAGSVWLEESRASSERRCAQ